MITFANPYYFILLVLPVLMVVWHFLRSRGAEAALTYASTEPLSRPVRTVRTMLVHLPMALRVLSVVAVIICLARPQTSNALREREVEGIDIILTMDISTSMLTPDIHPNRIIASRDVAIEFVQNRPNDNIGLVLFGGEAFMQCPMTTDHAALLSFFQHINCDLASAGVISPGTAIGMGLTNAVSHLENSHSKSKVVILLTDGVDNTGEISPQTAADLAHQAGVRVYTISLGRPGKSRQPIAKLPNGEYYEADVENTANPEVLRQIAQTTGGKFYTADSRERLKAIYKDIDALEKTKLRVLNYDKHYEIYQVFALIALCLLGLEALLRFTLLRRLP